MGRTGVSWRVWAVLCLQLVVVCADFNIQEKNDTQRNSIEDDTQTQIEARGKKKKKLKFLVAVLLGVVLIKGLIIPLALKAVSFVAGKAFLLSALSLILSSILGFKQLAQHSWDRMGQMPLMRERGEVTENSYLPMSTEAMYQKISTDHYWARKLKNI